MNNVEKTIAQQIMQNKQNTVNDIDNPTHIPFSQSTIEGNNKLNDSANKAIDEFGGLCQALCGLITIVGHDNTIFQNIIENQNDAQTGIDIINDIALDGHVLNLINIIEMIFIILFKMFPASPMKYSDQKKFLQTDIDGNRIVNSEILTKTFDEMGNNQYMELSFVHMKKTGPFNIFINGHATLIFKTIENEKTYYNFFDPHSGIFKCNKIDDLSKIINNIIKECQFTDIGIIDLKKILERNKVTKELMKKHNQSQKNQAINTIN